MNYFSVNFQTQGNNLNERYTLPDIFIGNEIWGFLENFEKNPHIFVPQNSKNVTI